MSYNYEITAARYGGEHTIGTIPNSVAEYWLNKDREDFEGYLFSWDREEDYPDIPMKYQLNEWHDIDNIMHECAVEFAETNWFEITDKNTGNSFHVDFSEIDEDAIVVDDTEMKKALKSKKAVIFAQSWEKGGYDAVCYDKEDNPCDFVTDEPFDVKKIKNVMTTLWNNMLLLHSFQYEDYTFELMQNSSIGKGMNAWILTNHLTKQFLNEENVTEPHYMVA